MAIRYFSAAVGDGVVEERGKQHPSFGWNPEPVPFFILINSAWWAAVLLEEAFF